MKRSVFALSAVICLLVVAFAPAALAAVFIDPSPIPLNVLYRVRVPRSGGAIDYKTTLSRSEHTTYLAQGRSDGAIFYIPTSNVAGTAALNRLYYSGYPDYMDSESLSEGVYTFNQTLGYPWTTSTATQGLTQVVRTMNQTTGDQVTLRSGEAIPSGYNTNPGYMTKWGYARYGNSMESLLGLSNGGISVESNRVAGGAVWNWTWNGAQFVNHNGIGHLMQAALFFTNASGQRLNPTEGGDTYTFPYTDPAVLHTSPLISAGNLGSTVHTTLGYPLEFNPDLVGGGQDNPVLYKYLTLGKNVTLNYGNMGAVARYNTTLHVPYAITQQQAPEIEIPAAHLLSNYDQFYTYDAVADNLTHVYPPECAQPPNYNVGFSTNYGGIIVTSSDNQYALGIFGVDRSLGGSVDYYTLWDFTDTYCWPAEMQGLRTAKMAAVWSSIYRPGEINAGSKTFTTWIVNGTRDQVKTKMHDLYLSLIGSKPEAGLTGGVPTSTWSCINCSSRMGMYTGTKP